MTTTDPTAALRDRIAAALYERERPPRDPHWPEAFAADREVFEAMADAVLAVLPSPADRAAVPHDVELLHVVDAYLTATHVARHDVIGENGSCAGCGLQERLRAELRRVAAEEQPTQTQARPLYHRWYTETRDGVADEWAPGMRFTNRAEALDRYRTVSARHPLWKDGTPVERRFVRETTSYTVEEPERPVVGEQPDTQEADRIVAYRNPALTALHCLRCTPHPAGDIWTPVTAAELEDGGICTVCGVDVLIPLEADRG